MNYITGFLLLTHIQALRTTITRLHRIASNIEGKVVLEKQRSKAKEVTAQVAVVSGSTRLPLGPPYHIYMHAPVSTSCPQQFS